MKFSKENELACTMVMSILRIADWDWMLALRLIWKPMLMMMSIFEDGRMSGGPLLTWTDTSHGVRPAIRLTEHQLRRSHTQ